MNYEKRRRLPNLELLLHNLVSIKDAPTFTQLQEQADWHEEKLRHICNQELRKAYKAIDHDGNVYKCMSPALLTAQAYFGRRPVRRPKPVLVYTCAEALNNESVNKQLTIGHDSLWNF